MCNSPDVLKVYRIIKIIITVIRITVPIILTVVLMLDFFRSINEADDFPISKALGVLVKRMIAIILLFFIPNFVSLIANITGVGTKYLDCFEVANGSGITAAYESTMDDLMQKARDNLDINSYNAAKIYLANIKDDDKKEQYLKELEEIEKLIAQKNENGTVNTKVLSDSIFMGDSRTVMIKGANVLNSNESAIATGAYNYDKFKSDHYNQIINNINSNPDKEYNIMLYYGVNDVANSYLASSYDENKALQRTDAYGINTIADKYCESYKTIASKNRNNKVYIVSVTPVNDSKRYGKTSLIEKFNERLKTCVSDNLYYCDIYNKTNVSNWVNYLSSDGVHYTTSGSKYVYDAMKECINNKNVTGGSSSTTNTKLTDSIFLGDSRTNGMRSQTNTSNESTIAKDGANYYDLNTHLTQAKNILNSNTSKHYNITLNYGANDVYDIDKYCTSYQNFINSIDKNNKVYIVSVNPVNDSISRYLKNSDIVTFNNKIKSCVSGSNVYYCDVYNKAPISTWTSNYIKSDGIHYTNSGYNFIYNEIKKCIN